MVGKRPRNYTRVSMIKLASTIYERLLATRPDMSPQEAAEAAREAVRRHARKHGLASKIYHEIKVPIMEQYNLPTADMGKVRVLIQKVVGKVTRIYEARGRPLNRDEIVSVVHGCDATGRTSLRLPEEVVARVIAYTLLRMPNMVPTEEAQAVLREYYGGVGL